MNYLLRALHIVLFAFVTASTVSLQAFSGPFGGASTQQDVSAIKKEIHNKLGQLDTEHNLKVVQSDKMFEQAAKVFGGKHVIFWYEQARINCPLQSDEQEVKDLIESVSYYILNQAIFDTQQHLGGRRGWFEKKSDCEAHEEALKAQHKAAQLLATLYHYETDKVYEFSCLDAKGTSTVSKHKTLHGPFREHLTHLMLMVLEINKKKLSFSQREAAMALAVTKVAAEMRAVNKTLGGEFAPMIDDLCLHLQVHLPQRELPKTLFARTCGYWWGWTKFGIKASVVTAVLLAAGAGAAYYVAPERTEQLYNYVSQLIYARYNNNETPEQLGERLTAGMQLLGMIPAETAAQRQARMAAPVPEGQQRPQPCDAHPIGRLLHHQPLLGHATLWSGAQALRGVRNGFNGTARGCEFVGLQSLAGVLRVVGNVAQVGQNVADNTAIVIGARHTAQTAAAIQNYGAPFALAALPVGVAALLAGIQSAGVGNLITAAGTAVIPAAQTAQAMTLLAVAVAVIGSSAPSFGLVPQGAAAAGSLTAQIQLLGRSIGLPHLNAQQSLITGSLAGLLTALVSTGAINIQTFMGMLLMGVMHAHTNGMQAAVGGRAVAGAVRAPALALDVD